MKRRLTIARSLVNDPELLLLDEPTTGLDPQARHLLWERLYRLKREGVTQIVTTHYMDEAEQLCDRLVVMDGGVIVAEGSPAELIAPLLHARGAGAAVRARRPRRRSTRSERLAERVEVLPDRLLLYTGGRRAPAGRAGPPGPAAAVRAGAALVAGRRVPAAHRPEPGGLTDGPLDPAPPPAAPPARWAACCSSSSTTGRGTGATGGRRPSRRSCSRCCSCSRSAWGSAPSSTAPAEPRRPPAAWTTSCGSRPPCSASRRCRRRCSTRRTRCSRASSGSGIYLAMTATPIGPGQVVVGHLAWMTIKIGGCGAVYVAVIAAFGGVRSPGIVLALLVAMLAGAAVAALGHGLHRGRRGRGLGVHRAVPAGADPDDAVLRHVLPGRPAAGRRCGRSRGCRRCGTAPSWPGRRRSAAGRAARPRARGGPRGAGRGRVGAGRRALPAEVVPMTGPARRRGAGRRRSAAAAAGARPAAPGRQLRGPVPRAGAPVGHGVAAHLAGVRLRDLRAGVLPGRDGAGARLAGRARCPGRTARRSRYAAFIAPGPARRGGHERRGVRLHVQRVLQAQVQPPLRRGAGHAAGADRHRARRDRAGR